MKDPAFYVLCIICGYFILKGEGCLGGKGGAVDSTVVTRVDTTKGSVTINNWSPRIVIPSPVPTSVDTQAILREYFATNKYDTTFQDSTISGTVNLDITQNKVSRFALDYKALNKTTTVTLREFKPALYVGGFVGTKNDFGASLIYADKTKAYSGGYNFQDKSFQVGIAIKLK